MSANDWTWTGGNSAEHRDAEILTRVVYGSLPDIKTEKVELSTGTDVNALARLLGRSTVLDAMLADNPAKRRSVVEQLRRYEKGIRSQVKEPYKSKLEALVPKAQKVADEQATEARKLARESHAARKHDLTKARRVVVHGRAGWWISQTYKKTPFDIDLYGDEKTRFLSYVSRGDIRSAMSVALEAWGGDLEDIIGEVDFIEVTHIDIIM